MGEATGRWSYYYLGLLPKDLFYNASPSYAWMKIVVFCIDANRTQSIVPPSLGPCPLVKKSYCFLPCRQETQITLDYFSRPEVSWGFPKTYDFPSLKPEPEMAYVYVSTANPDIVAPHRNVEVMIQQVNWRRHEALPYGAVLVLL